MVAITPRVDTVFVANSLQLISGGRRNGSNARGVNFSRRTRTDSAPSVRAPSGRDNRTYDTHMYAHTRRPARVKWPTLAENNVQFRRNSTYDPDSSRFTLGARSEIPRNARFAEWASFSDVTWFASRIYHLVAAGDNQGPSIFRKVRSPIFW